MFDVFWGVSQAALNLKRVCVCVLQVSVVSGALDCWVFLSCLEVLHRIEGCCDRSQLDANSSHTVGLWTYATEKVRSWLTHVTAARLGLFLHSCVIMCAAEVSGRSVRSGVRERPKL